MQAFYVYFCHRLLFYFLGLNLIALLTSFNLICMYLNISGRENSLFSKVFTRNIVFLFFSEFQMRLTRLVSNCKYQFYDIQDNLKSKKTYILNKLFYDSNLKLNEFPQLSFLKLNFIFISVFRMISQNNLFGQMFILFFQIVLYVIKLALFIRSQPYVCLIRNFKNKNIIFYLYKHFTWFSSAFYI